MCYVWRIILGLKVKFFLQSFPKYEIDEFQLYPEYLCPSPGKSGLHDVQQGEDFPTERHLESHHGRVGGAEHDELHLGLEDDVVVGVGHGLEAGDEAGQLVVSWRTGEEAAVHGDTPDHGLVVRVKTSSSEI